MTRTPDGMVRLACSGDVSHTALLSPAQASSASPSSAQLAHSSTALSHRMGNLSQPEPPSQRVLDGMLRLGCSADVPQRGGIPPPETRQTYPTAARDTPDVSHRVET